MKEISNKEIRKKKIKAERLRPLLGIDLCACGPMNCFKCHGICRESHKDQHGQVICGAKYQVDSSIFKFKKQKRKNNKEKEDFGPKQNSDRRQNRHRDS